MTVPCPTCGKPMRYLLKPDAWVCPDVKYPLLKNPEHWVGNEAMAGAA